MVSNCVTQLLFWSVAFKVILLENVIGLYAVMDKVKQELSACGDYEILIRDLNPTHGFKLCSYFRKLCKEDLYSCCVSFTVRKAFGVNVDRDRVYFVLVRRDYLAQNLEATANEVIDALTTCSTTIPW